MEQKFAYFNAGRCRATEEGLDPFLDIVIVAVNSAEEVIFFVYEFFVWNIEVLSAHDIIEQGFMFSIMWSFSST